MQRMDLVGFACAAITVWPLSTVGAELASTTLTIPMGLSGSVGSWSGPGWYIYWPSLDNPINGQLHRGPYSAEDQCQADLKELIDKEEVEDRSIGISPPSDLDQCTYFGVQPNFDRPAK